MVFGKGKGHADDDVAVVVAVLDVFDVEGGGGIEGWLLGGGILIS